MSASTIVVIACLVASSKQARDQILDSLHTIAEYSRKNEPGIFKYAICIPDNAQDETSIYVFEEYLDQKSYDGHMAAAPVVTLLESFKESQPPLLDSTATKLYTLSWLSDATLTRATRLPSAAPKTELYDLRDRVENPYVLFATITDPSKQDIDTLEPYGAAIVKYAAASEPDTIFYADAMPRDLTPGNESDDVKGGFICAVEVYATKDACMKHLQDQSVNDLTIEGKKLGSKFQIVLLNMKEGWLIRE